MEKSDYAKREEQRRFVVYANGRVHGETVDREQAEHVARLLKADGALYVVVRTLTANQTTQEASNSE